MLKIINSIINRTFSGLSGICRKGPRSYDCRDMRHVFQFTHNVISYRCLWHICNCLSTKSNVWIHKWGVFLVEEEAYKMPAYFRSWRIGSEVIKKAVESNGWRHRHVWIFRRRFKWTYEKRFTFPVWKTGSIVSIRQKKRRR